MARAARLTCQATRAILRLAALILYLLFAVGILGFAILPGREAGSLKTDLLRVVLFGLIAYATYGLANLATLKDRSVTLTVIDLAWGTVLSVAVSPAGYLVGKWPS